MTLYISLYVAGFLTILLPCILPLVPIVLGSSLAGKSKLRPLFTVAGMVVSFVAFTFLIFVVLRQFVLLTDVLRVASYQLLFLFGVGFIVHHRDVLHSAALMSGLFFYDNGFLWIVCASFLAILACEIAIRFMPLLQNFGSQAQAGAREQFGDNTPVTSFFMGLTMGFVWGPCAGPALGFAFTLVQNEPGLRAFIALLIYALGTATPLLLIGYGGQVALRSVKTVSKSSGRIKQFAGAVLIITALSLHLGWFKAVETWFVQKTDFGNLGVDIEMQLFNN